MSDPYIGQIILVGFNFAPVGYALCNGQLLAIAEYETLFNLIGTTYGGDGQETFALPDLRGRVPLGTGQALNLQPYILGDAAGSETTTLSLTQLAPHTHTINTSAFAATVKCRNAPGDQQSPKGNVHAIEAAGATMPYSSAPADATMNANPAAISGPITVTSTGGTDAHGNVQPFLTLNFCIALFGVFPAPA
jgi:microcystin-dependent protein